MMHHVMLLIEDDAVPFGIGHQCPCGRVGALVSVLDLTKWRYRCRLGCEADLPKKIAIVDVQVDYLRKPRVNEDAGQSS